ncbi:MAG: vWA domain-containing protein [Verrucomicrobiales bacterium]|nr:von Willebrand factor type A domain-containing protein [Verrucomicrobiota bacterium JB025]
MKPNQEQIEDQVVDALLSEQSRSDRQASIDEIENAVDIMPGANRRSPIAQRLRHLGTIAASMALGGLLAYGVFSLQKEPELPQLSAEEQSLRDAEMLEKKRTALNKAVRSLEDRVEERRKVLATIVRTKGIDYKARDQIKLNDLTESELMELQTRSSHDFASLDTKHQKPLKTRLYPERDAAIKRGLDAQDIDDAKREFVADQEILARMRLELAMMGAGLSAEEVKELPSTRDLLQSYYESVSLQSALSLHTPVQPLQNTERFAKLEDQVWKRPESVPLSTFSIDVDNASYSIIRRMIRDGRPVPPDAVRIEECINAFDYNYAPPTGDNAFAFHTTLATCPWNEGHYLAKIGIKGRELDERPASNLVFLIDVSGSMQSRDKLPLVKESLKLLLHQLDGRDSVSFVVYAGREGVALPPTKLTTTGRIEALEALDRLQSGGSTNGGAGIRRAYQLAAENYIDGGANRVLLATDGDFNVGVTNQKELVDLVKERASNHIYLSILGFGAGNLNDSMLEAVSGDGNGNYYNIDSIREGRKVLLEKLSGTLVTIAKDVKIQIEFNPRRVGSYRLIGYANRVLENRDFNDDKVDAGDIGAGHTVTAFYEIVPAGSAQPNHGGVDPLKYQKASEEPAPSSSEGTESEWLTLKLRHKHPEGNKSALQQSVIKGEPLPWLDCGQDFQFASAVALFGMKLRGMQDAEAITWRQIQDLAQPGLENDPKEDRSEFINLLEAMEKRGR